MKRAILLRTVSYMGTFVLGAASGAVLVFALSARPSIQLLSLATVASSGQDAYIAYRYGNYTAARDTLLKFVELVRANAPADGARTQSVDITLSYARLATLAEEAGKHSREPGVWRRAMESRLPSWQTATEEEVRQAVQRLDASWDKRLNP
jgi:hypothetical protein